MSNVNLSALRLTTQSFYNKYLAGQTSAGKVYFTYGDTVEYTQGDDVKKIYQGVYIIDTNNEIVCHGIGIPLDNDDPIKYITPYLSNATLSNPQSSVHKGDPYETQILIEYGYTLQGVNVTMSGIDVTDDYYDESVNTISIPIVLGNITIVVQTIANTYNVEYKLEHVTLSNNVANVAHGSQYTTTIIANTGYQVSDVVVAMNGVNITTTALNNNTITIDNITGPIHIAVAGLPLRYNIVSELGHATLSNSSQTILHGENYSTTFTMEKGYAVSQVRVIMNGVDVTEAAYEPNEQSIGLTNVNGDIAIAIIGELQVYSITTNLNEVDISNPITSITFGSIYSATLTPYTGKNISSVSILMGVYDITESAYDRVTGNININPVEGDIVINASASDRQLVITNNLAHATSSNSTSIVNYGDPYSTVITPELYYELKSVSVVMSGVDITSTVYNEATGELNIDSVTGDITIIASSTRTVYTFAASISHGSLSSTPTFIAAGETYNAVLTLNSGYELESIIITSNGENITDSVFANNVINIPHVAGNIVIAVTTQRILIGNIGEVVMPNIMIFDNALATNSGYYMVYENENNQPLSLVEKITEFTI